MKQKYLLTTFAKAQVNAYGDDMHWQDQIQLTLFLSGALKEASGYSKGDIF